MEIKQELVEMSLVKRKSFMDQDNLKRILMILVNRTARDVFVDDRYHVNWQNIKQPRKKNWTREHCVQISSLFFLTLYVFF